MKSTLYGVRLFWLYRIGMLFQFAGAVTVLAEIFRLNILNFSEYLRDFLASTKFKKLFKKAQFYIRLTNKIRTLKEKMPIYSKEMIESEISKGNAEMKWSAADLNQIDIWERQLNQLVHIKGKFYTYRAITLIVIIIAIVPMSFFYLKLALIDFRFSFQNWVHFFASLYLTFARLFLELAIIGFCAIFFDSVFIPGSIVILTILYQVMLILVYYLIMLPIIFVLKLTVQDRLVKLLGFAMIGLGFLLQFFTS